MKMTKAQERRASEFQEKETMNHQLRQWSIQRGLTPPERYKLGPTNTWHPAGEYYKKILPIWCPLSPAWQSIPSLPPLPSFFTLLRGGLLETAHISMRDVWSGTNSRFYVKDSAHTRDILTRLQGYPLRPLAWQFIKTRLVQTTFSEGWLILFKQVVALAHKLDKPNWQEHLDGRVLNLAQHVKVGKLIDAGLMPPDLVVVALNLLTVWVQEFLLTRHVSKGVIKRKEGGKTCPIVVVYGQHQLVDHQKKKLIEFYLNNLYRAPARFRRINE